jgi:hypothetical protein
MRVTFGELRALTSAGPSGKLPWAGHHNGVLCHGLFRCPTFLLALRQHSLRGSHCQHSGHILLAGTHLVYPLHPLSWGAFSRRFHVVPFGCGALVLLDKDDRAKFKTRCALMIFNHYATSHPLYTYAFYSPRSKRVLYQQDAIFLVNTFPMQHARIKIELPRDGDALTAFRSPLASWTILRSWTILVLLRSVHVIAISHVAWATISAGPILSARLARLALNAATPMIPTLAALLSFLL